MGSLYSYCGIITKLVYPPELSRIAGFCTNSNKIFWGRTRRPPFQAEIYIRRYYNYNTANHLKMLETHTKISPPPYHFSGKTQDQMVSVCLVWKVHCWSFFCEWMFERIKKSPWKLLEIVPQKSLKKVCHDLWEPCWMMTASLRHLTCHGGIGLVDWIVDRVMQVWIQAYPNCMWALWGKGHK